MTAENVPPELSACTFQVACDVTNPLCGNRAVVPSLPRKELMQQ
ncbi:MAG: glycerate kinase [Ruminococcus callidus]